MLWNIGGFSHFFHCREPPAAVSAFPLASDAPGHLASRFKNPAIRTVAIRAPHALGFRLTIAVAHHAYFRFFKSLNFTRFRGPPSAPGGFNSRTPSIDAATALK